MIAPAPFPVPASRRGWFLLAAPFLALLASCGDEVRSVAPVADAPGAWRVVAEGDLGAVEQKQKDRALAARGAMFQELLRTLSEEVQRGGPAGAIAVCRERAPAIAQATAKSHGVRIGRTSEKLRNATNAPPPWVAPLLADRPEAPRFASGPEGRLGAVLPIQIQTTCLVCHGSEETIPADVRTRLKAVYPDDRATGYRDGDLRGWFWVEVPAAP